MSKLLLYFLASTLLVFLLLPIVDPYACIESFAMAQMYKLSRKLKGQDPSSSSENICIIEDESSWPVYKVIYAAKPGVTVFGWPAKGGLYVLRDCLGLELDFLGLSRFEDTVWPGYDPSMGTLLEKTVNGSATLNQEQKQREEEEERHCDKSTDNPCSFFCSVASLLPPWIIQIDSNLYIACTCSAYARSNMV